MDENNIRHRALYQEVAERLRIRILNQEFPPGGWIDEQAIAAQYGISRTPLREALKVLASEGLVDLKPRRGCYVAEVNDADIADIFAVLALLEGRCAADATRGLRADELRMLEKLHEKLERCAASEDIDGFFEINQQFHRRVQEFCGNRWLMQMIEDLRKVVKLNRRHSLDVEGRLARSLVEHRSIMDAMRRGDVAAAELAMRTHIEGGRDSMLAASSAAAAAQPAGKRLTA
ncbi:MAG: GntR family transcriptional regulator [Rhodocyclaceae bacterium]|nr:GntR family transcriptional regulator [Rhodocyclaceae bacterium]